MNQTFDPGFGSALEAAAAIRAKEISSVELTEHTLRRIDAFEPKLNAYTYQLREQALETARKADEALARNEATGALHGVPINVKESFGVQGQPCTWGIPALSQMRAQRNSTAVQRLLNAGAVLLGATNVPAYLMDVQAFNDIYGVTNNPWDLSRTSGGSSGGSGASLAAGMAFLSIGSDLGGSIRLPASFCGVYGHKPTLDIVSIAGHLPGGAQAPPGFSTLMAVAGPMARSAEDLEAAVNILAGFEAPDSKAFKWTLPAPRHRSMREYRIGFVLDDAAAPVSIETKTVLERAIKACERAGATVTEGWPSGFGFGSLVDSYLFHLGAFDFSMTPPDSQQTAREHMHRRPPAYARGALSSFAEWQSQNMKRIGYRTLWEKYFGSFDVFLLPTTFTAAFEHTTVPADARVIQMPEGGEQPFWNMLSYCGLANLTGLPATAAPAGLSKSGLPVGIQIVAPYLEDGTSIEFARLLAGEIGGFQAPPLDFKA